VTRSRGQRPHPDPLPEGEGEERGIAVLALQGDFAAHRRKLAEMGLESFEARKPEELQGADGLVIPGGESTTFWKFFESAPWEEAIRAFAATGRPILGTCAGAIVLACEVTNPEQKGLGLIDMSRKASQPLEYAIREIDERYCFFSLKATV
jgi:5'-phosphate synthase pdxT subunit